ISKSDVHISYCDPVSCSKHPFLIFNIWSHSSDDLSAMDWVSVSRLNLLDLSVTPILNEDNLIVPRGYNRGWVSSILYARQDGEGIICTVGLQKQESRSFHQVDYWICEIPFKSKKIKKIADLPDTFI
ncbi:hypothetical protein HY772_10475, partial [Candidatus Woesearchaeota archaeon]|nr:hypothetical protein [Candidatus Woesearchaeota archaeon]